MRPARAPRDDPRDTRLLHVDPARGPVHDGVIGDLCGILRRGDLLVLNDAATLPASLRGVIGDGVQRGAAVEVEVRLAGEVAAGLFQAVLFGPGDWRTRTEDRAPPPRVATGSELRFAGVRARVVAIDAHAPRLVTLAFDARGDALWPALYRAGRPVQYAYAARPFALWDVQTAYATRPWAVEAPSAGFALTWDLLLGLQRAGVSITRVTHAAGLSSTGDAALDARLPFAERYEVTADAVAAIAAARAQGGRVVALGTTVVRALESAARGGGRLRARTGTTDLRLGPGAPRRVVDGLVTGVHDAGTSHFALLQTFASAAVLAEALAFAEARGYAGHEFGDACVIM